MSDSDNEDIAALHEAIAEMLDAECPISEAQAYAAGKSGVGQSLKDQAGALGWTGISAPEAHGGSDMGFAALGSIYQQLGSHLAPLPMLGQQLAIEALIASGKGDKDAIGALVAGTAWASADLPHGKPSFTIDAGKTLSGEAKWVLDDDQASHLLTFADGPGGLTALWVDRSQLTRTVLNTHDKTRTSAKLAASGVALSEDAVLASGRDAEQLREALINHAAVTLALDSAGGARVALTVTVEYLKVRNQFGRAIGSFQALKHRAATMKIQTDKVSALAEAAVEARGTENASTYASMAKARAADTYVAVAADTIQLHGGIGFTLESGVHLFLKRAKLNQLIYGDSSWHLDRSARQLREAA